MGYLMEGYKIMGKELAATAKKHRAGIGTAVSVGGTILSNYLSTRAGAKSARMIDAKSVELGRNLTTKEKLALCWKNHVGSGLTTVVSCVGAGYSHNTHVKDFNKVAMAYSGVKKLYDSAKTATREVLGEKKAAELQDKVNQKYIEEHPEVKQRIIQAGPNPDPSTMQKYIDTASGYVFHSTRDRIMNAVKSMQAEMKALPNRNKNVAGRSGKYGITLGRFHEYANPDITQEQLHSKTMLDMGFNKGKERNGSDDDIIDVYFTPMLINDDTESIIAINWEQDPSDMDYGDYVKS